MDKGERGQRRQHGLERRERWRRARGLQRRRGAKQRGGAADGSLADGNELPQEECDNGDPERGMTVERIAQALAAVVLDRRPEAVGAGEEPLERDLEREPAEDGGEGGCGEEVRERG